MTYASAWAETDLLFTLSQGRIEEFLYLDDDDAPRSFEYEIVEMAGVTEVILDHGTVVFKAPNGPSLRIDRPWLIDASGRRSETAVAWELTGRRLRLGVRVEGLEFPLLIDPSWSTTARMNTRRSEFSLTLLLDGRLLVAGGATEAPPSN